MKYLSSFIGAAIVGALVFGLWPELWMSYGILGGWMAAGVLIGICWFMNHFLEVIWNPAGEAWVDMGWAVGAAGIMWGLVRFYPNCNFVDAIPTLICCLIGGGLAGWLAAKVKRSNPNFPEYQALESEKDMNNVK